MPPLLPGTPRLGHGAVDAIVKISFRRDTTLLRQQVVRVVHVSPSLFHIKHTANVETTPPVTRGPDGNQMRRRATPSALDVTGRPEQAVDPAFGPVLLQERDSGEPRTFGGDGGFDFFGG